MNTPKDSNFPKAVDAAQAALANALGSKAIRVTLTETSAIKAGGEQLFRVTAIVPEQPNAPQQVVVDAAGRVHDLAKLEASIGRRLFVPDIGPGLGRLIAAAPERVTIDPSVNDLTLEGCRRQSEVLTVTIPVWGATPKAESTCSRTPPAAWAPSSRRSGWDGASSETPRSPARRRLRRGQLQGLPGDPYAFQNQLSPTTPAEVPAAIELAAGGGRDIAEGHSSRCSSWPPTRRSAGAPTPGGSSSGSATLPGTTRCVRRSAGGARTSPRQRDRRAAAGDHRRRGEHHTGGAMRSTTTRRPAADYRRLWPAGGAPVRRPGSRPRPAGPTPSASTPPPSSRRWPDQAAVTSTSNVRLVPTRDRRLRRVDQPAGGYGPLPGDVSTSSRSTSSGRGARVRGGPGLTGTLDVVADGVVVARSR